MEVVRHEHVRKDDDAGKLLDAAHQRHRAVLLLVVKKEGAMRKAANQMIAPVMLYKPVFPHAESIPKLRHCINATVSITEIPHLGEGRS